MDKSTRNLRINIIAKISLVLWALSISQYVAAANISIVVKQKGSGIPVEGATVVINTDEDNAVRHDISNQQGQVSFTDVNSVEHIKVLATGYETFNNQFSIHQKIFKIYLEPLVFENEGLEVTAERIVEKTSKLTLTATELTRAAGSGGDPLKAISTLPGIIPTEEGSAQVYMRGSNGNENITWINHAPVGYLYHFGGFQSTMNSNLIEDINIFLGGFPVEYGDALGGVVDARLKAPKNDRMHYIFDISTIDASFLAQGPVGNSGGDSFFIAGKRSYLDAILSPADASELFSEEDDEDPDQVLLVPRFYDFQTLYRHQLQDGHVDTYIFAAGDELALELRDSAKSDPQLSGEIREKISYRTVGTTWQQSWHNQLNSIVVLSLSHEKSALRIGRDSQGNPYFFNVESDSVHFQPELRWQTRANSQFSFGVSTGYAKIPVDTYLSRLPTENDPDFDFTTQDKYRLKTELTTSEISPYFKFRYQWNNKLTTQIGLRQTNMELSGGFHAHEFSPRASIEYKLSPRTLLSSTWGRYIQIPNGDQVVETIGNPALRVIEAEHRILGVEQTINQLYSLKAEVYHKPMKNLVIAIDQNAPPDNYANQGSGEAYGFDLFIKRKPGLGKIAWASLSWAKSKRTNELTGITRDFSGDQPLTLTFVWGQPFAKSWKRWDWSMKIQAHSGQPYTAVTGRHREDVNDPNSRWIPEYGEHNAERLPTYYKIDLRIGKKILHNEYKVKFYVDIQNITNNDNVIDYDYGNEYEKFDNKTDVIGMKFFPFFGVELEY